MFNGGQKILLAGGSEDGVHAFQAEMYSLNHRPAPVATVVNPNTQTVPGSLAAVFVSAAGSTDADGDRMSYVWSEGSTLLATSNDPTTSATVGLGIGTHTLTLTVSDTFDESSIATVTAVVTDRRSLPACRPDDDDHGHDGGGDKDDRGRDGNHDRDDHGRDGHDKDDHHTPKPSKPEPKPDPKPDPQPKKK